MSLCLGLRSILRFRLGSDCCFEGLVLEGFEFENVVEIVIRIEIKVDSET